MPAVLTVVVVDAVPASDDIPIRDGVVQHLVPGVHVGGQAAGVGHVAVLFAALEPREPVFSAVVMVTAYPSYDVVTRAFEIQRCVPAVGVVAPVA